MNGNVKKARPLDGLVQFSSRLAARATAVAIVGWGATAAASDTLPSELAPDTVEGTLWGAECIATPGPLEGCSNAAFAEGKPGGILAGGRFTVLLVDGHALVNACGAGRASPIPIRAQGVLHAGGVAMSVFRLEASCETGWVVVDLPYSGVAGSGPEGGDE
jgi:hypothetical protein